jgi:hypothetical protein
MSNNWYWKRKCEDLTLKRNISGIKERIESQRKRRNKRSNADWE